MKDQGLYSDILATGCGGSGKLILSLIMLAIHLVFLRMSPYPETPPEQTSLEYNIQL